MSVFTYTRRGTPSWRYQFKFQGREVRQRGFPTQAAAEHAERQRRRDLEETAHVALYGPIGPRLLTWPVALARYREAKAKRRTVGKIMQILGWWAEWAAAHDAHYIQALTGECIAAGLDHLAETPMPGRLAPGRSPQTRKTYLVTLSSFYTRAIDKWQVMRLNPAKTLEPIHVRAYKPRILTHPELRALLAAAEPMMRRLILMAIYTGQREMAIMGLTAEDCQIQPGKLRAWDSKPGAMPEEYFIPVAPPLAKVIQGLGVLKGPLWRQADGTIQHLFPKQAWHRAMIRASATLEGSGQRGFLTRIPITGSRRTRIQWTLRFHDLRHLVGVTLAEANVHPAVIQDFMHHATRQASERYTRWVSDRAQAAAGAHLVARFERED
jgi:integrase